MRIGLVVELNGTPAGGEQPVAGWEQIRSQVVLAEAIGFDSVVFEDGLLYEYGGAPRGLWESVAIAGAIAASTTRIEFGQSVINAPYRSPAMLAKIAITLDEISGGRYIFGIGAGNTPDSDYAAFGFPRDKRFSRFAEAIEVIHALLKTGQVDVEGEFISAVNARTVIAGPRPGGPPIVIAAGGPRMLRLVAKYADTWNWWTTSAPAIDSLGPTLTELQRACEEVGRDPLTLGKTVDLYSFDPLGAFHGPPGEAPAFGTEPAEMVDHILTLGAVGVDEVRCHLHAPAGAGRIDAIAAMTDTVGLVHGG
jgi:alkanesulfonate monooxygenase SsuD/methylene tetrahydromethanopterin reductase-like flavin-dependent oxidoreductase (luciferase family)